MFLHDVLIKVYETHGYKVFIYPFLFAVTGGIACGIIVNQLPEIYSFPLFGIFYGLAFGSLSKIFGIERVLLPSVILIVAVILCALLTLFAGLYFGAYFFPIAVGILLFSILLFLIDYKFFGQLIDLKSIWLYLLSALFAIIIIHVATIIDWGKKIPWLYLYTYPLVIYIFLQISIICRLAYKQ